MDLLFAEGYGLLLVVLRVAGLVMVLPPFGSRTVPARVRMGIAFAVAVAVWVGAGQPRVALPASLWHLAGSGILESFIGVVAGQAARYALEAALSAGGFAATAMGLNYGAMLDPINGNPSNAVSDLFNLLASALAVAVGLHREAIAWLVRSLREHPPGGAVDVNGLLLQAVGHVSGAMALAIRLGYPFLVVVTFGHLVLSLVGKTAPTLNPSTLGFAVSLAAGGLAVYLAAPVAAELAVRAAVAALQ
jgi:flagellar biosynthetic protein FliR